jgi:hypothetical protein
MDILYYPFLYEFWGFTSIVIEDLCVLGGVAASLYK